MSDSTTLQQYRIVRSERKTADIIVDRDGSLEVRAPKWLDDDAVASLIKSKQPWIHRSLTEWREANAARRKLRIEPGSTLLYLGRHYRVKPVESEQDSIFLKHGSVEISTSLLQRPTDARAAWISYLKHRAREKLPTRLEALAAKLGLASPPLEIRDTGNRWASISPNGALRLHWVCMMAPLKIVDYVLAHELCHLRHRNHTQKFWNEVDKALPDYRERKEWLRKNGAGLSI